MTAYTVACCHSAADMERELDIMVDNGCAVRDVIVEHPIYGQLAGSLERRSRYDVSQFVLRSRQSEALPLSSLTDGVHLHTLLCPDKNALERVKSEMRAAGIIFEEDWQSWYYMYNRLYTCQDTYIAYYFLNSYSIFTFHIQQLLHFVYHYIFYYLFGFLKFQINPNFFVAFALILPISHKNIC